MQRKIFILLITGLFPLSLWAHDPDWIGYRFSQHGNKAQLTIQLTPKGALDLLGSIKPEVYDLESIRFADYKDEFNTYFNNTISLRIEGIELRLSLKEMNLHSHDSQMLFDLEGFRGSFDGYEIQLSSFTEIYRRAVNHIFIPTSQGEDYFRLDIDQQEARAGINTSDNYLSRVFILFLASLAFVVVIILLAKQKIKVQPQTIGT